MTEPFLGEIRMFAGNFAPLGWATCDGQLMPISQSTALFSLLGTFYGGNGTSNFALPDLRGRAPMAQGNGAGLFQRVIGESGGSESVTLTTGQLPSHSHVPQAAGGGGTKLSPVGNTWAEIRGRLYGTASDVTMNANALSTTGGSQPHNNLAPYLAVTFIIALQGIFPARP